MGIEPEFTELHLWV